METTCAEGEKAVVNQKIWAPGDSSLLNRTFLNSIDKRLSRLDIERMTIYDPRYSIVFLARGDMSTVFRRSLAISLSIVLLYLSGVVAAQSAEHAVHHAHHQAAMHASLLCSWLRRRAGDRGLCCWFTGPSETLHPGRSSHYSEPH